jgi:hypothetical protein
MWMVEKFWTFMHRDRHSVDQIDEHSACVTHDLTNLRARIDVLTRLVGNMRADKVWRDGDAKQK